MLMVLVHGDTARDLTPPGALWGAWNADWTVVAMLAGIAIVYARGVRVGRRSGGARIDARQLACFVAGFATLALALVSPLDALGETIFAAHMAQHLALIVVAAPLLVLGMPPVTALWALPLRERRVLSRWWLSRGVLRRAADWITRPSVALVAQTAALWFWHFPRPYQLALRTPWIHALEHGSFLGTAVLFWWSTLHPTGRRRLSYGGAILCMGATLCQSGALGALLMFSTTAWYPAHAAGEALWGMTPIQDQQLAGLMMWIPAGVAYIVAAAALFLAWMEDDEMREAGRLHHGRAQARVTQSEDRLASPFRPAHLSASPLASSPFSLDGSIHARSEHSRDHRQHAARSHQQDVRPTSRGLDEARTRQPGVEHQGPDRRGDDRGR